MPSRKDCIDDIIKRVGGKRTRRQVEDLLEEILDRADNYRADGAGADEAYIRARNEMLDEQNESRALRKRAEIMDARKALARQKDYKAAQDQIAEISKKGGRLFRGLRTQSARLALEAKLVGINLPIFKGRKSVDAQFVALRRLWVGGFARDLEKDGLLKLFASRQIEEQWTDELHELNKGKYGKAGITKNEQALKIAKVVQKWQRISVNTINREGGWIRSYSGYITKSSWDADEIRRIGPESFVGKMMSKEYDVDFKRTFDTDDKQRVADALRQMWTPLKNGDHFDYSKISDDPIIPNIAARASAVREIHFKSGAGWRKANEELGLHNPTTTVVKAFETAAQRAALLKEFGTRPLAAYNEDKRAMKAGLQLETQRQTQTMGKLQADLAEAKGATTERTPHATEVEHALDRGPSGATEAQGLAAAAAARARREELERKIADLTKDIELTKGRFSDFESWEQALDNRFAQIDGRSKKPVNTTRANVVNNWMAIQRMAKLGRVALTHLASLPTKSAELAYWGVPFSERFGSMFRGFTSGLEGSAKREALDATLVAFENRLGHMMSLYDVADAPAGYLAKAEQVFFKLTGVSAVIDNQRGDAEAMFAAHVGSKRDLGWENIGPKEQRVIQGFGIGKEEWSALKQVEWSNVGGRTYLFPDDAMKLSDAQIKAYLKEKPGPLMGRQEPTPDDIGKAREDLALSIASAYTDRAGYAIPNVNARTRAIMFGKNFEPGTAINAALRLIYQFKMWPADMISRAWGREVYGRMGDGALDRMAGLVEMSVGMIVFGVASEIVREEIQGRDAIKELATSPLGVIMKGAQRSGMGSLVGDFLLGEFDRHGFSAVASLSGPTFGQIDTLMDLLHAGGETKKGTMSDSAWKQRGADAVRLMHDNIPFQNLWATSWLTDYLIWHRLQEWIRPGYLRRSEDHSRTERGTEFWAAPSRGGIPGAIGRTFSH